MKGLIGLALLFSGCIKKPVSTGSNLEVQSTDTQTATEGASAPVEKEKATAAPESSAVFDKRQIDAEIKNHMEPLQSCYTERLKENPKLSGFLMVKFVIEQDGSVSTATTTKDSVGSELFTTCILEIFMTMKFPAGMQSDMVTGDGSLEDRKVTISYPLRFASE